MFRKLLFAVFTLFVTFSFSSCEIWEEDEDEDSSWSALCRENSWLYEFPTFSGNYSSAQVTSTGDALVIFIDGVEDGDKEWARYTRKLEDNGFKRENEYTYSKTSSGIDYEVSTSSGVISISFAKVDMN